LKQVQEQLIPDDLQSDFLLINRSTLIAKNAIDSFDEECVYAKGEKYEISKTAFLELKMWKMD